MMTSLAACLLASAPVFADCSDTDRRSVLAMRAQDQAIREDGVLGAVGERRWANALQAISNEQQVLLRQILSRCGWTFGRSAWGEEAEAAWYIVQHGDNLAYQRAQLGHLQRLIETFPGIPRKKLAYLEDRVLIGEGRLQRYGSQLELVDGKLVPFPISDPAEVDQRRASMGLGTMEAYLVDATAKWKAMAERR
ncbi:DUF6624 domain-containing protein [Roseateles terrae]|uniref:Uncharacterized protein n=1 Tax=Roseateles terrae TaxID=431060 RepID=A0ABR6GYZ4_9BURK|nr:DUF6624 domain-containing protein [Roseateles terrae]MBB3197289.1 hypothetical protein [Roseateles terrae]